MFAVSLDENVNLLFLFYTADLTEYSKILYVLHNVTNKYGRSCCEMDI